MDKLTILVTGGAGYIGSVVVNELRKLGCQIIIIDDLSEGNKGSIPQDCIFYQSDFGDSETLEIIYQKYPIDIIIHLAAKANVPDSVANPISYYQNNVISTFNLLNFAVQKKITKILFSSTAAVYGDPIYTPIDENHQTLPVNPYGWSKLMCEQLIKDYAHAYGISFVIFRYFCAAGAAEFLGESRAKETHIIPLVIDQLVGHRHQFQVFGTDFDTKDGTGVRDFVHVLDIAHAHVLCIQSFDKAKNKIFNLGSKEGYSVIDILHKTESLFNQKLNYIFSDRRPGDPGILIASNEFIYQTLGWKPERTIDEVLLSAYQWQKNKLY
jgi:UDP-glucose 4-epimerase